MRGPLTENRIAWLVLLAVLLVNAAMLRPELAISRVDLNDNVFHFALIERMAQAIEHGGNPIDCWSAEWTLGYPVLRTYQPLAHLLVVGAWLLTGKHVALMSVFVWARFLAVVLLPLSFFAAARLLGLRPIAAAAAAVLAPMLSTNFLYGVEYGSFTWAGSGLYPQSVAAHLLLWTIGFGCRALRRGTHLTLAGAMLGLTFLAHFIYGYIGALSICLLAVMPDATVSRALRIRRTLWVGAAAFALAAFQLAPLVLDRGINHSRWEFSWKWDSFGPSQVLEWLVKGELLDYGRLPVLTLLALGGAAWFFWCSRVGASTQRAGSVDTRERLDTSVETADRSVCATTGGEAHAYILLAAGLWIAILCGRPLWGPLLDAVGISRDVQLHRVIGGAQVFLVLLAAVGLTALGGELGRRKRFGWAGIAVALLLYPMVKDRSANLSHDAEWGRRNLLAYETAHDSLNATLQRLKERGGRVYPGLAASWGGQFKIGDVPLHAFLATAQVPTVSFLYHSMALTSDVMVRFNEFNPDHYRLFNIQTVVAPAEGAPLLPPFIRPVERIGRFALYNAPGGGYFDLVEAEAAVTTSRNNFFDVNDRWMASPWPGSGKYLLLDWRGDAPPSLRRIGPEDPLPGVGASAPMGVVGGERHADDVYEADLLVVRAGFALFKMTWHENWKAELDGKPVPTVMLSPGFAAVAVSAGEHHLRFRYQPEWWRAAGPFIGIVMVILMVVGERIGWANRFRKVAAPNGAWPDLWTSPDTRRRLWIVAGIALLVLPVCLPLISGQLPDGHDAMEYFPRLTEFHENIANGILLPRWAPDLSSGNGQPLFLFNPPLIYYAGEFWHLLGFSFVTAMNLACVMIVVASGAAMFLLGRLYFGERGGWLAAAALLYAPYFAVDLYVRSAMAEFAAFPFAVMALYGFGAYARKSGAGALLIGAMAYAGVMCSHNAAALLFTPLLLAFIGFTGWRVGRSTLLRQVGGFALGLGLSAAVWLPSLTQRDDIHIARLLEGYLRYSGHFVYLQQLLYSPWGYGVSVEGPNDQMSFSLGWGHLVLAVLAWMLAARIGDPEIRRWLRFFTAAAAVLCFLMLRDAEWIWDGLPLLQYVEFPWRILGPVALSLALLVASLASLLDAIPRWRNCAFAVAMALLIVPNLSHLAPRARRDVDLSAWTPSAIASRGIEVTTAGEYVPRWVEVSPPYNPHLGSIVDGDAEVQQTARTPVSWSAQVAAKRASAVRLAISYFPGWQVRVDGTSTETKPATGTGQIQFDVPPGDHRVEARWSPGGVVWLGDGISLASLAALLVVARRNRSSSQYARPRLD